MITKRVVKEAFIKSIPVMAGYIILGIGFGVLLKDAGYGVLWALSMSVLIYAGALQYVGVGLIASGAGLLNAIIASIAVNARHLFYSISMIEEYKGAGKKKPYLIFALTDETYSLLCDGGYPEGEDKHAYRLLVSLFNQCYWVIGSVAGNLLGDVIPFDTTGIEFSMTALFLASFISQWKSTKNHIPALIGVVSTVLCLLIFGTDSFLIPSMFLITFLLLLMKGKLSKKEDKTDEV